MYYIEIKDQSYPVHYGHSVLRKFMHKYKMKKLVQLGELPSTITMDDMPEFVKDGFDTGAKINGNEPPFTMAEVKDLLEENFWIETAALEAFGQCMQRPSKGEDEDEDQEDTKGEEEKN